MPVNVEFADRLAKLPPYLFAAIDEMKLEAVRAGKDVINLGVGDPDLPTPPHIIERLIETAPDPANHQYPSYTGMMDFRKSITAYYKRTRGIDLDPASEALTLIGSKEGVGHAVSRSSCRSASDIGQASKTLVGWVRFATGDSAVHQEYRRQYE